MKNSDSFQFMSLEKFKKTVEKVKNFVEDYSEKTSISEKKILVVGDIGLDKYLYGSVERISPEAPVPIVNLLKEEKKLGLAANVAKNLSAMEVECDLLGVVGADLAGEEVEVLLSKIPHLTSKLLKSKSRPTTEKTRVLSGQHHLIRLDSEQKTAFTEEEREGFNQLLESFDFNDYSHVILEDYGKGVLSKDLSQNIIKKSHAAGAVVLVDPAKGTSLDKFKGADYFKPNFSEISSYSVNAGVESYEELLSWVLNTGEFKFLVSTLGAEGMSLCDSTRMLRIPTFARKVFDVTGAGDTVIAALSVGLSKKLDVEAACLFANFAAGFVVGKVGAVSCRIKDVEAHINQFSDHEIALKFSAQKGRD